MGLGDFNNDGKVDINDLTIVLADYGQSSGSSALGLSAVPEPAALALLAGGFLALLVCGARRKWPIGAGVRKTSDGRQPQNQEDGPMN